MKAHIYTLTSQLHDRQAVDTATLEFLSSLNIEYELCHDHFDDYGSHALDLIYVRTGGTEGIFRRLLPQLQEQSTRPFFLLTSGKSNSLAASMEILSFLRQHGISGEILHGSTAYISRRIQLLGQVSEARNKLSGSKLGVVGKPSDWLISSAADAGMVKRKLGIELKEIEMPELLTTIAETPLPTAEYEAPTEGIRNALPGAWQIYHALRKMVDRHALKGLTIRCFDLLSEVHNTGCIALAQLNSEGIVAGCEGDVPAMLSMAIANALTGVPGFQANPSSIDPETGQMVFAHCTIPLCMVQRYELDTHFESGIGVGIRGYMQEGPVTIFKVSGDLSRHFIAEGTLIRNEAKPDLCRTQQVIQLSNPSQAQYFLTNPIGNHHIILPGKHQDALEEMMTL